LVKATSTEKAVSVVSLRLTTMEPTVSSASRAERMSAALSCTSSSVVNSPLKPRE